MEKYILIILFSLFFLAASCSREDDPSIKTDKEGAIIEMPFNWRTSLHASGQFASNSFVKFPIQYNGNVAVPTTNGDGNRFLTMLDAESGNIIWQWDDRFKKPNEYIDIYYCFQYNNLLSYQYGGRSYCIDLKNGTSHWKIQRGDVFESFNDRVYSNEGNTFFLMPEFINEQGYNETAVYLCNINTGELSEFLRATYSGEYINPRNSIGSINGIVRLSGNEELYAVVYSESSPNWVVNSYLGLYNNNTKQWEYERKLLAQPTQNTSVYWPQVYNNKFYAAVGPTLVCRDLTDGRQMWIREFTQDFMFSGFIIEEDKIIANNEDTFTYCLNPDNGSILWKTESAGTSGHMSYLNGIVYFVGGSTGKLHAIDIATGKHVWKLDGKALDGESFKTDAVYALPAKNGKAAKIIANTHIYSYCFDAYK